MYSGGIATWVSGKTVSADDRRGWRGQLWTANDVTSQEPQLDSAAWTLDTPLRLSGVTLIEITDPKDFLRTKVTGITLVEQHVNRPPEVYCSGLTFLQLQENYWNTSIIDL